MSRIYDWIMDVLYALAVVAIGWLPDSPFASLNIKEQLGPFSQVMGWINYFVPIGTMLGIMTAYVACVAIWYAARWVLRLTRYID